jgi:hypothetical protein
MQRLYEITIPGLSMTADFPAVHHRLLADFPDVVDVLAMTTPATVLVVYTGEQEVDQDQQAGRARQSPRPGL